MRPAGAVVCFGYIDHLANGEAVPLVEVLEQEPAPLIFPVCQAHRRAIIRWAAEQWGHIAPGMWVDGEAGIDAALRQLEAEGGYQRMWISPEPEWAVRVEAV